MATDETVTVGKRGRLPAAAKRLVERASRIDWRSAEDNRYLRAALRRLFEALGGHVQEKIAGPVGFQGVPFSGETATRQLFQFLLHFEALDLIGIAHRIRSEEHLKIQSRRQSRRSRKRS